MPGWSGACLAPFKAAMGDTREALHLDGIE